MINFIASTVETLREEIRSIREEMATKEDLTKLAVTVENMRDIMATKDDLAAVEARMAILDSRMSTKEELAAVKAEMATKDDLKRLETKVTGDFEQVHLRFDNLDRVISTRFEFIETEVSRLRSAVYLLARDQPDILRLLGRTIQGEG